MKKLITICAVTFVMVATSSAFAGLTATPVKQWTEEGPVVGRANPNLYYGGGVFNGNFYVSKLGYGPLEYSSTQTSGSALVNSYDIGILEGTIGSKTTVRIGEYVFYSRTGTDAATGGINRLDSDWTNSVPTSNYPAEVTAINPGDTSPEGLATDGTHLFTNNDVTDNKIHKYSITNTESSFSLAEADSWTISEATRFRALSHYNDGTDDLIYVIDYYSNDPNGNGIYEINVTDDSYTRLGTHAGSSAYQVVRYNDELLVVGLDDNLTVYDYGNLSNSTAYDLGMGDLYGLGVVGDGTDVTGFWVTSAGVLSPTAERTGYVSHFAVPEPATMSLLAIGGLAVLRRRRRKNA